MPEKFIGDPAIAGWLRHDLEKDFYEAYGKSIEDATLEEITEFIKYLASAIYKIFKEKHEN